MNFTDLKIIDRINDALVDCGYSEATDIQEQAIPVLLDNKDVLASAQTGTGKTAAFAIPMLQKFYVDRRPKGKRKIRGLVIAPTRELAQQIYDNYVSYGKYLNLKVGVIFGGVSQKRQEQFLNSGVDIIVATPGRLMDLMDQGKVDLTSVEMFVLDEADRLLDMGFIHDINKIAVPIPDKSQTLLFSATMPKGVIKISQTLLKSPVKIHTAKISSPVDVIDQKVYFVDPDNKKHLLLDLLKSDLNDTVLIFARTKNNTEQIVNFLKKHNIESMAIHGDKSQNQRIRALNAFKAYKFQVLVATDVASRGIDIDSLGCVVNYNIPEESETYIHRIGRTGRANETGRSVSFCDYGERGLLKDIEALMEREIEVVEDHDYPMVDTTVQPPRSGGGGNRQRRDRKKGSDSRRRGSRNYKGRGGNTNAARGENRKRGRGNSGQKQSENKGGSPKKQGGGQNKPKNTGGKGRTQNTQGKPSNAKGRPRKK